MVNIYVYQIIECDIFDESAHLVWLILIKCVFKTPLAFIETLSCNNCCEIYIEHTKSFTKYLFRAGMDLDQTTQIESTLALLDLQDYFQNKY